MRKFFGDGSGRLPGGLKKNQKNEAAELKQRKIISLSF